MLEKLRHGLTLLGVMTARPAAFLVFVAYGACWFVLDRESDGRDALENAAAAMRQAIESLRDFSANIRSRRGL